MKWARGSDKRDRSGVVGWLSAGRCVRSLIVSSLATLVMVLVLIAWASAGRHAVKRLDADFLGGVIVDTYSYWRTGEDWSNTPILPAGLDYTWANADASGAIRVAHALGGWGRPHEQDTMSALRRSLAAGMTIVEVDLSLAEDGILYCFHGPGEPTAELLHAPDRCDLAAILMEMRETQFTLVVDLKSDFDASVEIVRRQVRAAGLSHRIVFQLYQPSDIARFAAMADDRFAGPIVTVYRSFRGGRHLRPHLERIGARVITVPVERMFEFGVSSLPLSVLLTHPIQSCAEMLKVRRAGYAGGYTSYDEDCQRRHALESSGGR